MEKKTRGRKRTRLRQRLCLECNFTFNLNEMDDSNNCPSCGSHKHAAVLEENISKNYVEGQIPMVWISKEDWDAEKSTVKTESFIPVEELEKRKEVLLEGTKGTGKQHATMAMGERAFNDFTSISNKEVEKSDVDFNTIAPKCVVCGREKSVLLEVRKMITPNHVTRNPKWNAELSEFKPLSEIEICSECEKEYMKNNKLVYAVPQMVRKYDKVGRNDPCPCGSGKKYKKCHITDAHNVCVPLIK